MRFFTIILFQLTLFFHIMPLFNTQTYAAGNLLPEHNISISFDLRNQTLKGTSQIELPAEVEITISLDMVSVKAISLNGNTLSIPENNLLNIPSSSSEQRIIISFENIYPAGSAHFNAINEDGITLTDIWHPLADKDMIFKLTASIPADYSAISEADEIITFADTADNNNKMVLFRFPYPLRVIHFAAGPYIKEETNFSEDKTLRSFFFTEDKDLAHGYREKTKHYLDRYEDLLGPYPYSSFSIVENRLPTGFAMPTFTLLGQAVVRLPFIKDTSLGHEVLHEWFGNGVRIDMEHGNWSEGLTAYLADHAFAVEKGSGSQYRKEQLIKYQSFITQDNAVSLEEFTGAADDLPNKQAIRAVGYSKSSMFFHILKITLGDTIFQNSLRDFYTRMKYQQASWADLMTSFENVANIQLAQLFEQWLTRTDIPELTVKQAQVSETNGRPVVTFQLLQKNDPPYQLTVPFTVKTGRDTINKSITISETINYVEVPLISSPTELIIDPSYDIMRKLSPAELPPTWSRFEGSATKVAIIAGAEKRTLYEPLIALLESMNCIIINESEVADSDLSDGALIFLGAEGHISRSLFSQPKHPLSGITIDIRNNPLNALHTAILVSAESRDEVAKIVPKLAHYGKYSYLHFQNGRNKSKQVQETDSGLRYSLIKKPKGIATQTAQSFEDIVVKLLDSRVIYVGETHTSNEDHLLQLRIIRELYDHDPRLAIGMEMFSKTYQSVLDDYLERKTEEKEFLKESDYFNKWSFDYRYYRDIIKFARRHKIPIIALNLEKTIVSNIFSSGGTGSLNDEQRDSLPVDRDLDVPGYRTRLESVFQHHALPGNAPGDRFKGFLQAQALWDETMAETIADYLQANPDHRMVVIAGRGHTDKDTAIPPRVYRRLPVTQNIVLNANGNEIDAAKADFLFFSTPEPLPPMPLLGVMLSDTEGKGALVTNLSPKGKAKEAGIMKNDMIVALDNEPVTDIEDVKILMLYKVGSDSVAVRVKREHTLFPDEELEFDVSLKSANHHGE